MNTNTHAYWETFYGERENFARVFLDYAELKAKQRTQVENIQFRVVGDVIDGMMTV